MNQYSREELAALGVQCGMDVRVSRRAMFYAVNGISIGDHSRIDDGCIITGSVVIGKRVHLAPYCVLYGKAGITIDDYSGFGAFTAMHSESDDYSGRSMFGPCVPDDYQPYKQRAPIKIGRAVLGGTRCTLLPGVTVGDGATIGAHSLVRADCDRDTLYVGTPAMAVRHSRSGLWDLVKQFELESQ